MENVFNKGRPTQRDIQSLIDNQIEESLYLEYKSADSLSKSEGKKKDISKDISCFANSDGGVIIYGIAEKNNVPDELSFINGNEFTKEWLEQVINSTVLRTSEKVASVRIYISNKIAETMLPFLLENKDAIEKELGESLQWNAYPENRDKVIALFKPIELENKEQWPEVIDWMVEKTLKFRRVFTKWVKKPEDAQVTDLVSKLI